MESKKVKLTKDNDLLSPLNEISDFTIGNEKPEDVGYGETKTLPEHLAHFQMNPNSIFAAHRAVKKYDEFVKMVLDLKEKIRIMHKKVEIKEKISGYAKRI